MTENVKHTLVEVPKPRNGKILCTEGTSENLERTTRVVSDRVIFVDNISDALSKEEFVEIVRQCAVRGPIVDIKFLKRTKGGSFAFIEFENEEDGREAVQTLNKKEFTTDSGKVLELRASIAENPHEAVSNKNLYVKGIPRHWTNEDLKNRFQEYGNITHCRVLKQPGSPNENTGVGFVHFQTSVDAAGAIEGVDERPVDASDPSLGALQVKWARAKKPRTHRGKKKRKGGRGYDRGVPNWGGRGRNSQPNWNRGRGNMRGRNQWMYPPNEEVWHKMVELMQNMSMWQSNPYNNMMWQHQQQTYPTGQGQHTNNAGNSSYTNNGF